MMVNIGTTEHPCWVRKSEVVAVFEADEPMLASILFKNGETLHIDQSRPQDVMAALYPRSEEDE